MITTRRHKIQAQPTEEEYTPAELEFAQAMQSHRKRTGKWFPTWKDVLEVLQGLGYVKPVATPEVFHDRHSHLTEVV